MYLKLPENEGKIFWTQHSKKKLRQYRFSEKRVLRILRKPDRQEEGIAPGTIAAMQITGTKKHPTEAWVMYVILKKPKGTKMKKMSLMALLVGAALFTGLGATSALAEGDKCGAGKCGSSKPAKCGAEKKGKCGGAEKAAKCGAEKKAEKCGGEKKPETKGKCGAGKCGK